MKGVLNIGNLSASILQGVGGRNVTSVNRAKGYALNLLEGLLSSKDIKMSPVINDVGFVLVNFFYFW